MPNHICYNDHTGAHVACGLPFHNRNLVEEKSISTNDSNHNESMNLKQTTKLKDCRCSYHRFIPSKIILFLITILLVAVHFSSCSYGSYYSMMAGEEESSFADNAIDHDFSVMAISAGDDACGLMIGSSDDYMEEISALENISPLITLFGMDWEMLRNAKFDSYFMNDYEVHNQLLNSASTGMILHPSYNDNNQPRCTLPPKSTEEFKNHQCSKLDGARLSQCSPTDHVQDANKSSRVCPLRKSKYLHLYTHYTISTMKGLLLSDDIISIIVHQKMLQIQPKYFPLVFWLMVIGLAFSYFHIISGMSYDDISHRHIQHTSQSEVNSQSNSESELGCMDSDSTLSYHTALNECDDISVQTFLPFNYNCGNHGVHLILDTTSEPESDLELFPLPVAAIPTSSCDSEESPMYTEGYARVVFNPLLVNQPPYPPFIHQLGGIPSPDFLIFIEDYPPPVQETQQSKSSTA